MPFPEKPGSPRFSYRDKDGFLCCSRFRFLNDALNSSFLMLLEKANRLRLRYATAIHSGVWSGIAAFTAPALEIISVPVLAHALGVHNYGIYVLVVAYAALGAVINPGLSFATMKRVSECHATDDLQSAARYIQAALAILFFVIAISLSVLFLGMEKIASWMFDPGTTTVDPSFLMWIVAILTACIQTDGIYSFALKGAERFKLVGHFELVARTLVIVAVCGVALYTKSIIPTLVTFCAGNAGLVVCRIIVAARIFGAGIVLPRIDKTYFSSLLGFGVWMWLQNLAGILVNVVDKIVIGKMFGPASVGRYNILLMIAQLVHFVPANLLSFVMPMISKRNSLGELMSRKTFSKIVLLVFLISAGMSTAIWILDASGLLQKIFSLQAGEDGYILFALTLCYFIMAMHVPAFFLLLGIGKSRRVSMTTIFSSIVGLASLPFLLQQFDMLGAAYARYFYAFAALSLYVNLNAQLKK